MDDATQPRRLRDRIEQRRELRSDTVGSTRCGTWRPPACRNILPPQSATIDAPEAPPLGIPAVMVAGSWVIDNGLPTGNHPGRVLRSPAFRP
jgi:hypothetical protein